MWDEAGQVLIAVIYETETGLKVISKHIDTESENLAILEPTSPPTIGINLIKGIINIRGDSPNETARLLSNFSPTPFTLNGIRFENVEGFIQGITFPEGNALREACFRTNGQGAKKLGRTAKKKYVWWNDEQISYRSPRHTEVIIEAIKAKFAQNPTALKALLATEGYVLTHVLDQEERPDTSLPASIFCEILRRIREVNLQLIRAHYENIN